MNYIKTATNFKTTNFFTNCLLESTDQGRVSILSLLDLSAAFNTVDHSSLLERLHTSFGIIIWFSPSVATFIYPGQISGY